MTSHPPLRPVPNAQVRANVRAFYIWIASMILVGASPIIANRLVHHHTLASRIAGVAVGVGGMLPWIWVMFGFIRRADEYTRRMHLVALGGAFAATLVLIVTLAMLRRAHFIGPPDLLLLWVALILLWAVALLAAKRYFERP